MKRSAFTLVESVIVVPIFVCVGGLIVGVVLPGCEEQSGRGARPVSASGVRQATARIEADPTTGLTVEQANVKHRLENDNKPGSLKHLYIISPLTGDVLIYSAVKGKVTSGGKRLTPTTVSAGYADGQYHSGYWGPAVNIGGTEYHTPEIIQDDGTYGSSSEYIFWWDTKGIYHQQGVSGALWHVSDQPLNVKAAVITIDAG